MLWAVWLPAGLLNTTLALQDPGQSIDTPPLPLAPPVQGKAGRMGQPEILYINFDGAVLQSGCGNEAHYDCSTLTNLFDGYVGPYRGNETQRMNILQATRKVVAEFGIQVVAKRPPDDVEYTMVLYGELGPQSFAGIAPYIDCEDLHANDTSFTQAFSGSNTGSTVVLQEAAHTWGLEHVDSEFDVLNPFKSSGTSQSFLDECLPIVANTDLEQTAGSCNQIHQRFCPTGQQNSYREMLYLFGPHVPDVEPPTVELTFPEEDDLFVAPASFQMQGTIDDNLHPQVYSVQVFLGDELVAEVDNTKVDFPIKNAPPGTYQLRVVVTDGDGNQGVDEVAFEVLPEGSELPEDQEGDPGADDDVGSCTVAGSGSGSASLLPLLGLWLVRRRRP